MRLFDIPQRNTKVDIKSKLGKTKTSKTTTRRIVSNGKNNMIDLVNRVRQIMSNYNPKGVCNVDSNNIDKLDEFYNMAVKNKVIAIDTETTGLDPISDMLVGVGVYTPGSEGLYIPVNHVSYMSGTRIKTQITEEQMKSFLVKLNNIPGVKWIYHNAKFDVRVIRQQLGVYLSVYWDTSIGAALLNENEIRELKVLWNKYCNKDDEQALKFKQIVPEGQFHFVPLDCAYKYGGRDPKMTYELFEFQKPFLTYDHEKCISQRLQDTSKLFHEIEIPLVEHVADMEDEGVYIDVEYANELTKNYTQQRDEVENKIQQIINEYMNKPSWNKLHYDKKRKLSNPVNIASPTQLSIIMYDVMQLENPLAKNAKEKKKGTGADILQAINNEFTNLVIQYRKLDKLISTYTDKLPQEIKTKTGKIHASFNQNGTDTGRFSSSDPNLQNIPSKNVDIRKMFIACKGSEQYRHTKNVDTLTHVFVGSDYSQQEPRILAYLSKDESLRNAYLQGKDIYATVGSIVYNCRYEDCLEFNPDGSVNEEGKKRRNSMKTVVLGIMYGRGDASVAEQLDISVSEAKKIIQQFFDAFPNVKKWVNDTINFAKKYGYIVTLYGRKRRLPDIRLPEFSISSLNGEELPSNVINNYRVKLQNSFGKARKSLISQARQQGIRIVDNGGKISHAERQAINSTIQGSAADMTKKAMLDIATNEKLKQLGYSMTICVHDEIIGTCPYENRHEVAKCVAKTMIDAPIKRIDIPMKVDVEITPYWYGEQLD